MTKSPVFKRPTLRIAGLLAVTALAFGLSACDKMKEPTVGQKIDAAVEQTEKAAAEAKAKAQQALESAGAKVEQGAVKAEAAAEGAGDAARQAGNAVLEKMDDAAITAQVSAGLAKDPTLSALKIDVDTRDGVVTLNGPAPTQEAKDRATAIAQGVKGVSSVMNQLSVKAI
ncbi:MAG: BON domain-containing protein [Simplicispira sp.]|jgi:osmotically-inducible protein OsmY|uniref:BON domain-containing protein n=1 Tax=Simplicispira sp. TaxID=2015802 RepID=UPI001B68AC88|nr:BON domain-containing protein [Simplicispira sp.]MBP7413944.1 BON domain-containing protein [Giesbergeria sp.]MDD2691076.1 BON domain-containing protein [Simplicispira sp.]